MNFVDKWLMEENVSFVGKFQRVYLRFGLFSPSNCRSLNFRTGAYERGLSVYRAELRDGVVCLDDFIPNAYAEELRGRLVWAVTGREVAEGSDGEPILRGVKLVKAPIAISVKVA